MSCRGRHNVARTPRFFSGTEPEIPPATLTTFVFSVFFSQATPKDRLLLIGNLVPIRQIDENNASYVTWKRKQTNPRVTPQYLHTISARFLQYRG